MRARRLVVHGRVQGVNFRAATRQAARARGVAGWVRNRPDGAVEAHLEGLEQDVERVEAWIQAGGPPAARVERLEADDVAAEGVATFEVRG